MSQTKLFVFEADRDVGGDFIAADREALVRLVELGDAFECALALLERCTLPQLHALKLHHLLEVQKKVAKRTAAECKAKAEAEAAGGEAWDMDDRIAQRDPVGPPVPAAETFDLYAEDDGPDPDEPTVLDEK